MHVDHVGYLVKNIEKSICEFKKCGFRIVEINEKNYVLDNDRKCYICFMALNNTKIELVQPCNEESNLYSLLKKYCNQPYHICFESDDINNDIIFLSNNGFSIIIEKQKALAFNNRSVVFMFNSKIGMIELLEK